MASRSWTTLESGQLLLLCPLPLRRLPYRRSPTHILFFTARLPRSAAAAALYRDSTAPVCSNSYCSTVVGGCRPCHHHVFGSRILPVLPTSSAARLFGYRSSPQLRAVFQAKVSIASSAPLVLQHVNGAHSEIIYPRNFPPDARTNVPRPSQFGITDYEELMIPTPDGESLSAFYLRANKQHARNVTILMFHGNAGNIGYRIPIGKILESDIGCNVLMLQYRGYGFSTGTPNEKGLMIDAQTGLDYIRQRSELRGSRIVLYGQSIGGAVAIALAARNLKQDDISGIILENTFLSIRKLIPA